jgi:uncharacterized protein YheU (UPF0270 family)
MMTDEPLPIDVPFSTLSRDALVGVIEAFVLREGTEYGEREASLEDKVAQVMTAIEQGECKIVFDPATETTNIVVVDA